MLIVTLALVASNVATVSLAVRVIGWLQRAHARREDLLLNQLLHATGKPWQPAPATETTGAEVARVRFTASPEQLPIQ